MERETLPSSPVYPLVPFWIAGLVLGKYLDFSITQLLIFCLVLIIFCLFKLTRNLLICLAVLGTALLRIELSELTVPNHLLELFQQKSGFTQPIEGIIRSEVNRKDGKYHFILKLKTIKEISIQGNIDLTTVTPGLSPGDLIQTVAMIRSYRRPSNFLGYDYSEFMLNQNIHGSGYALTPVIATGNRSGGFTFFLVQIRSFLKNRIESRFGNHAGFVKAVFLGEKRELDELKTVINKAGLAHLLAVSGLHVGIIYLLLASVFRIIMPVPLLRTLIIIPVLLFYAALCNWSPSVSRAVIMVSLYSLSQLMQRKVAPNHILLISLMLITALNPEQLFSIGFQLSFSAVFVLLNFLPSFNLKLKKISTKLPALLKPVFLLIETSLLLSIWLSPLTLFYFNQINFNGLIANLAGIPLIGLLLPLMIIILILPGNFLLLSFYQSAFEFLMLIFARWTEFTAALPLRVDFISFSALQLFLSLGILVLLCSFFRQSDHKKFRIYLLSALSAVFLLTFIGRSEGNLKITFFDCGLGDLIMLESPGGENMLIDTGPSASNAGHFKNSALSYFRKRGVKSLDKVVVTHAHNDHYGGLEYIFGELNIKELIVTDEFQSRTVWAEFEPLIEMEDCRVVTVADTGRIDFAGIDLRILHPDRNYYSDNINNMSIVIRLDYGEFSVIFSGDLEREGEEHLILLYPEFLDCDLLKVGHHGSRTASSPEFVQAVSPGCAIIMTAVKNRFDFPHPETLEMFEFLGEYLFITGRDGAIRIETDGSKAVVYRCLADDILQLKLE